MTTLSIPQHRDPVARAALIACALALVWLAITGAMPPAQAQEQPTPQTIILIATPTLPAPLLPTEAPVLAQMPVVQEAAPTAPVESAPVQAPPIVVITVVAPTATSEPPTEAPPTPGPGDPGFAESFKPPTQCSPFIGYVGGPCDKRLTGPIVIIATPTP
jgi:hypothetical protein